MTEQKKAAARKVWIYNPSVHAITLEDGAKLLGGKQAKVNKKFAEMLLSRGQVEIVETCKTKQNII